MAPRRRVIGRNDGNKNKIAIAKNIAATPPNLFGTERRIV